MSITEQDLQRLQKLCAIDLGQQKEKFLTQLTEIINFVSQLQEIDIEWIKPLAHPIEEKKLELRKGVKTFEDSNLLFQNVKHPIKDNMIVIKSAIK